MKKFKTKHLKKITVKASKVKFINPAFNVLIEKRKNFIKDSFRNNLFNIRQLKQKLAVPSLNYFKLLQKKNKHFNINDFLKKYFLRLDVILFISGFFSSVFTARQAILYKKIYVNGQVITKNNFLVQAGDIITCDAEFFKKTYKPSKFLYNSSFFETNFKILTIIILSSSVPQMELVLKLPKYKWLTTKHRFR